MSQLEFEQKKYTVLEKLIPTDLCRVATKYALIKESIDFEPETVQLLK
jgi:hypothetical protein